MKRYNRDKRGTYNARTRKINIHEVCDTHEYDIYKHIHIKPHYDGYSDIRYDTPVIRPPRTNKTHIYIGIHNAIRDIFPHIDAPHTQHIYRGTAPTHKIPPEYTRREIPRYMMNEDKEHINKDTRTVKCIIMNDKDEVIYIGNIRRTREVNYTRGTIHITLHKGERTINAHERAIDPNMKIHGITVSDIKAHDVEIYYI